MALTTKGCNFVLDSLGANTPAHTTITHASLHTASPGDSEANELTAGAASYARKAISFSAASSKVMNSDGVDPVFNVSAGVTVSYVGFYTALTGGHCLAWANVTDEVFGSNGTYTLTDAQFGQS
jgi:hypothetical protein